MSWSIKQIVREEMANAGRPPSEVACTFLADYCYVRFGEVGGSDISIGITRQAELSGPDAVREVVRAAIASGFPTGEQPDRPRPPGAFIQACKDEFDAVLARRAEEETRSMLADVYSEPAVRVRVLGYDAHDAAVRKLHRASESGPGILADGRTAREVACDERWTAVQYRPAHCRRCGHDRGCMCPRSYEA